MYVGCKRSLTILSFTLVFAFSPILDAQEYGPPAKPAAESEAKPPALQVNVAAQVRLREEVQDGTFSAGDPNGQGHFSLTHLRNRASVSLRRANLSLIVEAQDSRWLGEAGTTADSEGLDLRRGALKVEKLAGSDSWLEAGRMVLAYGDQRLVGSLEWVNQARTFDGGRLRIVPNKSSWVDVFWTVTRETKTDHNDQYFGGVYSSMKPVPGWTSEVYGLSLIDRMEGAGESGIGNTGYATAGTRQAFAKDGIDARFEGAVQFGELNRDDLLAYGAALRLGYTIDYLVVEPNASVEAVYGSGDSDATDGDAGTFQTLFPTNHMHYGQVDQAAWSNLTSVSVRAGLTPFENVKAWAAYHHLRLSDEAGGWYHATGQVIRPGSPGASTHLGDEVDVVATWKWRPDLTLQCGYGIFVPGAYAEDTGESDVAHFGYLQLAASLK
jgi:hypothetical protein